MGAVARLYQGGTLITATSIQYNQTSTSSLYVSTNMVNESGASWYSQGILYKWNGNGYESIILPKTPTLNTRTLNAKTNSNGETYGSGEFSASDLDLIRARGTNGKNGYVRSVHLEKKCNSPDEALCYRSKGYEIPLYKSDGETIIGNFKVDAPTIN